MMDASRSPLSGSPARRGAALTVLDGHGGALGLDLAADDLRWLADACRRLVRGSMPFGACALKVRAAEKCYLVSRTPATSDLQAAGSLTIANLYDSGESVTLAGDLAEVLASLIDEAILRRERALIAAR